MSEIIDIKIGQSLPPEVWLEAADRLERIFPQVAKYLLGEQDTKDFMNDAMLALVAMRFVGISASECCRFIPIPWKGNEP